MNAWTRASTDLPGAPTWPEAHDALGAVDGAPIEVLPHFWMLPGVISYDGHVPLAVSDESPGLAEPDRPRPTIPDRTSITGR